MRFNISTTKNIFLSCQAHFLFKMLDVGPNLINDWRSNALNLSEIIIGDNAKGICFSFFSPTRYFLVFNTQYVIYPL